MGSSTPKGLNMRRFESTCKLTFFFLSNALIKGGKGFKGKERREGEKGKEGGEGEKGRGREGRREAAKGNGRISRKGNNNW